MTALFNDAVLRELFTRRGRTYAPDSVIFLENDRGDEMFIIVSGEVEITKLYKEQELFSGATLTFGDKPEVVAVLEPGDFFGEMALWNDAPRMASARARTQVEAIIFGKHDVEELVQRSPKLAVQMLKSVCQRLREASRSPRLEQALPMLVDLLREIQQAATRRATAQAATTMTSGSSSVAVAEGSAMASSARKSGNIVHVKQAVPVAEAAAKVAGDIGETIPESAANFAPTRKCSSCGEPARAGDRYCSQCGRPLADIEKPKTKNKK